MLNLNEIKKKINSINNISKITNTMKLIAISKINKLKNVYSDSEYFVNNMLEIFYKIFENNEIVKKNNSNKKLWILVSSNLGMAGSYNLNNFNNFSKKFDKKNDDIIVIGEKGHHWLKKNGYDDYILKYYKTNDKNFEYFQIYFLSKFINLLWLKNQYSSIQIQYIKFFTKILFQPSTFQLLPIVIDKKNINNDTLFNFEPQTSNLYNRTLKYYINTMLYSIILEAKLCEYLSRKNTMTDASNNEEELIKNLKIFYNKKRQENITSQSLLINSGVNKE